MEKGGKLNFWACGLALGIVWGVGMLFAGVCGFFGWSTLLMNKISMQSMTIEYVPSFWGALTVAIGGFVDGFIAGIAFAFLYNFFVKKLHSKRR